MNFEDKTLEELKLLETELRLAKVRASKKKLDSVPLNVVDDMKKLASKLNEVIVVDALVPCRVEIKADGPDFVSTFPLTCYFSVSDIWEIPFCKNDVEKIEKAEKKLSLIQNEFNKKRYDIEDEYGVDIWDLIDESR